MDLGNYGVSGVLRINLVDYGDAGFTITGSTAGFLKINFRNPGNATFILELENLSGQLIYRRTGIQGSETEFPIIPETDGIIIVRLIGNDGTRFTGKWLALSH